MKPIEPPHRKNRKIQQKEWISRLIQNVQDKDFFGTLTIHVKEGEISLVEQTETFKPPRENGNAEII